MRITMLTATPQSVREGSGTYVAAAVLRRGLEALGHEVRIVAPEHASGRFGYTAARFRFNRRLSPSAVAGSDVVVGWDMDGYRLAGRVAVPYVAYVHGILAEEARFERGPVAASMRLQARAERRNAHRADAVFTVSAHARRRLAEAYRLPAERVLVVPPAFEAARWEAARRRVGSVPRAGPPTVLAVGRMYPRKDHATLVRAAWHVRKRFSDLRVVLAGDGPERRRLERLVRRLGLRNTVEFAGQLPFDDLVRAYAECDVFCLPSRQEGFGIVFLEALAAGKPVVACRGTAPEELIREGDTGALVPAGDELSLADALEEWLGRARTAVEPLVREETLIARFDPARVGARFLEALIDAAPELGPLQETESSTA